MNIYYIPIGVKSTAQIIGLFGDQKNTLTQLAEFGLYTRRVEMLLTRKLVAGLWLLLHVMRGEIGKQFILARACANRRRPLLAYLATTRAIYQATEACQSARGISVRCCVNRQRRSRTCWLTLGSHGNRSWQEYCSICTDTVN